MDIKVKHRKAKARFWQNVAGNPLVSPEKLTQQQVATFAGTQAVTEWLTDGEFHDWFFNREYNRQLLEAASEDTVSTFWDIVLNPDAKASDKIAAGKVILTMAGYTPEQKVKVKTSTAGVDEMTEEELRKFISEKTKEYNGKDTN